MHLLSANIQEFAHAEQCPSYFNSVQLLVNIVVAQQDVGISTGQESMLAIYQERRTSPDGPLAQLDRLVCQYWAIVHLHKYRNDDRQSDQNHAICHAGHCNVGERGRQINISSNGRCKFFYAFLEPHDRKDYVGKIRDYRDVGLSFYLQVQLGANLCFERHT